ncbi:MAG: lytic transglycosylase domain-containing protein [Ruminococcaceae bacterium]|nr:lytic transglycosylase domain-containing protein [Oscillospiraceae bacterium]
MSYSSKSNMGKKYAIAIAIVLAASVLVGFLADFIITKIEYSVYKKPGEYASFVDEYSEKYDVPQHIIYAVMKAESGFDRTARSQDNAIGLMQMVEDTFMEITEERLHENLPFSSLYEPQISIRYGTYYLSYLYKIYGNWSVVFAAYNAGLGNVNEWLASKEYSADGKTLDSIPFKETRKYVSRVERYIKKYDKLYPAQ